MYFRGLDIYDYGWCPSCARYWHHLVSKAKTGIVLVTFAAHRVRHLCAHLTQPVDRGVELILIVENKDESEGRLTRDAIAAFRNVPSARIFNPSTLVLPCQSRMAYR
jgi:hypothetical protein